MNTKSSNPKFVYFALAVIMIALGTSDVLRGLFAPIFETHYHLNSVQLGLIITVSYVGPFIFVLLGGCLADHFDIKKVCLGVLTIWLLTLVGYIVTDSYSFILVGVFFNIGASTLMNTLINLIVPTLFINAPIMVINTLFFFQGIGMTASQKLIGSFATDIQSWRNVNGLLLVAGIIGCAFFTFIKMTPQKSTKVHKVPVNFSAIFKNPCFLPILITLGLYCIAEHGILNWLVIYGTNTLGKDLPQMSTYLSLFYGTLTLGRLIFAPIAAKMNLYKSLQFFGFIATLLYVIGALFPTNLLLLLSLSGLFFSIIYPSLLLVIQDCYEVQMRGSATGILISLATLFDIFFNFFYSGCVAKLGYKLSFLILPCSMILFYGAFLVLKQTSQKQKAA